MCVHGHEGDPLGSAELGLARAEIDDLTIDQGVEVPPSALIAHEVQYAIGGPAGLEDADLAAPRDQLGAADLSVAAEFGQEEPSPIPRHVRVLPGDPGQGLTVGGEARCGEEVVPVGNDPRGFAAVRGEDHQFVDGLAVLAGRFIVAFALRHDPALIGRELQVGESLFPRDCGGWSDGFRTARFFSAIDPMILGVGEPDRMLAHTVGAAAVLVYAVAEIEGRGDLFAGLIAIQRAGQEGQAPALVRPVLHPPGSIARHAQLGH